MADNPKDETETVASGQPSEAVPMVGEYVINYDALTREEIEATCPETEALLARSILIWESPDKL